MPQAPTTASPVIEEIGQLKRSRDAVILAHYYAPPEVQRIADHVGDSFALAKLARTLPQQTLVVCGVRFMGESAKLLNPAKTVLLPAPRADCPMAHMVDRAYVERLRAEVDDLAVVCYVNSTAEIKSWSDVCVTSSNAVKVCSELPQRNILFIPDANLGRYIAEQLPQKHVYLNEGCCPRHQAITADGVRALKARHPGALVLAHPECTKEVLALTDFAGSTKEIIEYAAASPADEFIILTVEGVSYELECRCPQKRFHFLEGGTRCPDMELITLEGIARALRGDLGEVEVDSGSAPAARRTLDAMLEYAGR